LEDKERQSNLKSSDAFNSLFSIAFCAEFNLRKARDMRMTLKLVEPTDQSKYNFEVVKFCAILYFMLQILDKERPRSIVEKIQINLENLPFFAKFLQKAKEFKESKSWNEEFY
jgi:hypothetical protein